MTNAKPVFGLADCNSAYTSFECVFAPWLKNYPIVALSNNDANVVARNKQAKLAGIAMGQPWHELRPLLREGHLHAFSSNFALYQDMSNRVMKVLASHVKITPYSIDEAWLDLSGFTSDIDALCRRIKQDVQLKVGVSVGIGIGHTKVLAKLANWASKKWPDQTGGVVDLRPQLKHEKLLRAAPVSEVWGIGPALTERLKRDMNITSAWQLANAPSPLIRKVFGVTVERTARELAGTQCFAFEDGPEPKKTITSSRSFGEKIIHLPDLQSAVASFVANAAAKLRAQNAMCNVMTVHTRTSPFSAGPQYAPSRVVEFYAPTNDSRLMTASASEAIAEMFKPGFEYAAGRVLLSGFVDAAGYTPDLFAPGQSDRCTKLMSLVDSINLRVGRGAIRLARERVDGSWRMRQELLSPRYTTRWTDLPVAN